MTHPLVSSPDLARRPGHHFVRTTRTSRRARVLRPDAYRTSLPYLHRARRSLFRLRVQNSRARVHAVQLRGPRAETVTTLAKEHRLIPPTEKAELTQGHPLSSSSPPNSTPRTPAREPHVRHGRLTRPALTPSAPSFPAPSYRAHVPAPSYGVAVIAPRSPPREVRGYRSWKR